MSIRAVRVIVFQDRDRKYIRDIWEAEYKFRKNGDFCATMQEMFKYAIAHSYHGYPVEIQTIREEE